MEQSKIDRINFLARKSRTETLSTAELEEQKALREEYIKDFRKGFINTLEHTVVQTPDGNKTKLEDYMKSIKENH